MSVSTTRALRASAMLIAALGVQSTQAQIAKGASKFLGNITTDNSVRSGYINYWNQITPENESKWGTVQRDGRTSFSWGAVDRIRDFAEQNKIPWKFHTLIWGSQYPNWITSLSQAEQKKAVEAWMDATAAKYPNVQMIDVVNEAYPGVNGSGKHAPPPFAAALGGDGATGFDWIINCFKMARQRWPKAILIYNDYNNVEYKNEREWTVKLVNAMVKAGAPIDGIGCQAHDFDEEGYRSLLKAAELKASIDQLAATGLPIFITEYDISYTDDAKQKQVYMDQFPVMWNHPKVAGITIWGYVVGKTWSQAPNSGLVSQSNVDRPAMTWLKDFVKQNPNPPSDFPDLLKKLGGTVGVESRTASKHAAAIGMVMRNIDGRMVMGVERNGAFQEVSALGRN